MSCPYFRPVERRAGNWGPRETMMPLGGVWTGSCSARPGESWTPDEIRLRRLCNLGYARNGCDRFPQESGADAVRFTILGDDAITLRVYYVVERDHHPAAHGPLDYRMAEGRFEPAVDVGEIVLCQALAYVETYLALK
jgi:hypothetical protein